MLEKIIQAIAAVPDGAWQAIGAAFIASPLIQALKRWASVQSEKVMITLVAFVSFVAAGIQYLVSTPSDNPLIIVLHTAVVGFASQPVYFFFVKPLYMELSRILISARKFNDEVKTAVIPEEGLPISAQGPTGPADAPTPLGTSLSTEDFSN